MKALRKILDNIKPHVQKGGKFEMFRSTFDAMETLFFVPDHVTLKGSHGFHRLNPGIAIRDVECGISAFSLTRRNR
jgi:hypothetical protein